MAHEESGHNDAGDPASEDDLDILVRTGLGTPSRLGWQRVYCRKLEYHSSPWTKIQRHARRAGTFSAGGTFGCRERGKWRPARFYRAWRKWSRWRDHVEGCVPLADIRVLVGNAAAFWQLRLEALEPGPTHSTHPPRSRAPANVAGRRRALAPTRRTISSWVHSVEADWSARRTSTAPGTSKHAITCASGAYRDDGRVGAPASVATSRAFSWSTPRTSKVSSTPAWRLPQSSQPRLRITSRF